MGERAREVWTPLHVTAKRAVLEALGMRVIIHKRKKPGPGFDPTDIEIRWCREPEPPTC